MTLPFQSTHPARGCDSHTLPASLCTPLISIHAPRKGVRHSMPPPIPPISAISIHAPRKGVRRFSPRSTKLTERFQSTHPARGCDQGYDAGILAQNDFNPRTPQGGATRGLAAHVWQLRRFQSTHPARGCDVTRLHKRASGTDFNPRTPQGGATGAGRRRRNANMISIHAPRKGVRQQNCVKIDTIAQFCELSGNDTSRNLRFYSL